MGYFAFWLRGGYYGIVFRKSPDVLGLVFFGFPSHLVLFSEAGQRDEWESRFLWQAQGRLCTEHTDQFGMTSIFCF